MKIMRIYLVGIVILTILLGCATAPKEKAAMPPKIQAIGTESSSVAMVTGIDKEAVKEKPGVTRVIITLDKKAKYSTLRNGNQLIVNIHGANMTSSLKQLEVRDPVIKSVLAKQVGTTVKSVIDLVDQDIAYHLSKSEEPFQILVDIWQISPKTGLKSPSEQQVVSVVPAPVQPINSDSSPQRTQEVSLGVQTSSASSPAPTGAMPPGSDVPGQLQWFSEKLSQVLQEKEKVKQDLLEIEKNFAVKDSMIQVLERKLKEANNRVVELEEELIKAKSKVSLADQNQMTVQMEIQQLLNQLEQVVVGGQITPIVESTEDEMKSRSERILDQVSTLQQESMSLSEIKDQVDALSSQIDSLVQERDSLLAQNNQCLADKDTLQAEVGKLAAIENELRSREIQLARVRDAIGTALAIDSPQVRSSSVASAPRVATQSEPLQITTPSDLSSDSAPPRVDTRLKLEQLIQEHQVMSLSADPGDYVLGPDDVVRIKVLNEEGLDKTVTVSSDGFITYPLLGDLRVDGLTTIQLDAQMSSLLARDFLVDPEVIVEVVKPRSKKVYIMGGVKQPGYHELQGDQKLLGTMLAAGGPNSFDSEVRILRLPKDQTGDESLSPIIVDLNRLFVEGDQTQNIVLRDGDVLMVASKSASPGEMTTLSPGSEQFYVVGSVVNPGIYNYKPDDTVLDAILRAGGFTEFASRNSTKVVREANGKTRTMRVKMKDVMEKGEMDKNIMVMPGDMIIVPESFF